MTEDNIVLEHLRNLRNELRDLRRDMQSGFSDMRSRMTSLETRMVSLELHGTAQYGDTTRHGAQLDELKERVEAIERRLELSDT